MRRFEAQEWGWSPDAAGNTGANGTGDMTGTAGTITDAGVGTAETEAGGLRLLAAGPVGVAGRTPWARAGQWNSR